MASNFDINALRGHLRIAMSHTEDSIKYTEALEKEKNRAINRTLMLESWITHLIISTETSSETKEVLKGIMEKTETYEQYSARKFREAVEKRKKSDDANT